MRMILLQAAAVTTWIGLGLAAAHAAGVGQIIGS